MLSFIFPYHCDYTFIIEGNESGSLTSLDLGGSANRLPFPVRKVPQTPTVSPNIGQKVMHNMPPPTSPLPPSNRQISEIFLSSPPSRGCGRPLSAVHGNRVVPPSPQSSMNSNTLPRPSPRHFTFGGGFPPPPPSLSSRTSPSAVNSPGLPPHSSVPPPPPPHSIRRHFPPPPTRRHFPPPPSRFVFCS